MAKFIIDFWMDGYDSERDMIDAARDYIFDTLDSSGTTVKIIQGAADGESVIGALAQRYEDTLVRILQESRGSDSGPLWLIHTLAQNILDMEVEITKSNLHNDITVLAGNYTVVPPWLELIAAMIRIADCLERIERMLPNEQRIV